MAILKNYKKFVSIENTTLSFIYMCYKVLLNKKRQNCVHCQIDMNDNTKDYVIMFL